jgi:hypothetical protein
MLEKITVSQPAKKCLAFYDKQTNPMKNSPFCKTKSR